MEDFEKVIEVINRGESDAKLDYEVEYIEILGDTYEIGENYTSDDLENMLNNNYPFKITVEKSGDVLIGGTGNGSFTIRVVWPYESGNDALDTYWGNKAYEYYENNPNGNSVLLRLKLMATQS